MSDNRNKNFRVELLITIFGFVLFYLFNRTFLLLPYLLILSVFFSKESYRCSPMVFFIVPWTFMFIMYSSDFITYTQDRNEPLALVYLISGCLLIYTGYRFAQRVIFRIPEYTLSECECQNVSLPNLRIVFNCTALIGLLGSLLFVAEMLFVTGINLTSLSMIREAYTSREVTVLSQLGNIMSWGSIFVLPAIILYGERAKKIEKFFWIISVLVYSMYSVLSAGRQVVFQILIILLSSFIIKQSVKPKDETRKNKRANRRSLMLLVLVMGIILGYCLQVASDRNNGGISDSKLEVLSYYTGCKLNPKVEVLYNMLPDGVNDGIAEAIVYYTHEITGFKIFWNIDESIGPFWGLYSAPFLDRRIASLGWTTYTVDQMLLRNMRGRYYGLLVIK